MRVPLYDIVTRTFIPTQYYESLKLYYGSHSSSLELKLGGTGVDPSVELIPKGDTCDMGHVVATDTTTKTLQVRCLLINRAHATNVAQNVPVFFFGIAEESLSIECEVPCTAGESVSLLSQQQKRTLIQ